jgi:hypothetical protein
MAPSSGSFSLRIASAVVKLSHGKRWEHRVVAKRRNPDWLTCVSIFMRARDWIAFALYAAGIMIATMLMGTLG